LGRSRGKGRAKKKNGEERKKSKRGKEQTGGRRFLCALEQKAVPVIDGPDGDDKR